MSFHVWMFNTITCVWGWTQCSLHIWLTLERMRNILAVCGSEVAVTKILGLKISVVRAGYFQRRMRGSFLFLMKETAEDIYKGPFNAWLHKIPFILNCLESEQHKSLFLFLTSRHSVTDHKRTLVRITISSACVRWNNVFLFTEWVKKYCANKKKYSL